MSVKANKSLDDGLVLYVPMNEGSGSTGFDRAKGNNNAIIPSDIWEVDTEKGVVPHFNNLASKNLDIPASTDYDLQEQTISFWFKIDAIDGLEVNVLRRDGSTSNWRLYRNAPWANGELASLRYYMGTDALVHTVLIRRIGWEINTWYHVCMVFHADGKSEDYVNGVLWSDNAIPSNFDYWNTSTYKYFTSMQGYLKDVRVYNRALTETEVSALYRLGENKSLSDGLVLYVPMNEGSGSTVFDKSKYSNNGTVNGATWTTDAEVGECLSFDGVDDYAVCPFPSGLTNITFTCWVNLDKNKMKGLYPSLLDLGWSGEKGAKVTCHYPNYSIGFRLLNSAEGYGESGTATSYPYDDKMHFISCTYDGTTIKVYLDGVFKSEVVWSGNLIYPSSNLEIFRGFSSSSYLIGGKCKDVRVYNRALSATEIGQLYRLTKKGVE